MWQLATRPVPPPNAAPSTAAIRGLPRRAPMVNNCSCTRPISSDFGPGRPDLAHVHACAEGLAVPGEQDRADARIAVGIFESGDQFAAKSGVQGIALFRAVEDYAEHPSVRLDLHDIAHDGRLEGQPETVLFGRRAEYAPNGTYYRSDWKLHFQQICRLVRSVTSACKLLPNIGRRRSKCFIGRWFSW